ncbi:hypothetical protein EDB86DRAFT_2982672, partial [Lactarius hatsudake]
MDSRDGEERTSSHAAARGGHLDVVEPLLESGADVNVRDGNNELPLDVSSRLARECLQAFWPSAGVWPYSKKYPMMV